VIEEPDSATARGRSGLHDFGSGTPGGAPAALVVVVFVGPKGTPDALAFAEHWQPAVPEAAFVGIELDPTATSDAVRRAATDLAMARAIDPTHVVFVGSGDAGRLAAYSILQGTLTGAGVIGLDIVAGSPCPRVLSSATMVRLVQHCTDDDPHVSKLKALVDAMRPQELDVRSMVLPKSARADSAVAMRAVGTFLVEVVAKASRITPTSRSLS
jgi:hypothetical protein